MKRFHSELAGDPAYYSFGYSVYGTLEDGDDFAMLYGEGYLPFVGVEDAPKMMYMARSGRIRAQEFRENTYHTRIRRKFSASAGNLSVRSYPWTEYPQQAEALRIIGRYFRFRHGTSSMPPGRLEKILTFDPAMRLVEYRIRDVVAGYSIEMPMRDGLHQWYFAYTPAWKGKHLGAFIMLDVIARAKESGLAYAYIGATYGPSMIYKTNFRPLEYWGGYQWVQNADRLKALLRSDSLRTLVTVDAWRDARHVFYPAPFGFESLFMELRFIYLIIVATPRVAVFFCAWLVLMALVLATTLFP